MAEKFYPTFLPQLIFSPSNCSACPFQFALGQWMKLQLKLCLRNISNRSFTLQVVEQKIHDIIRPFSLTVAPLPDFFSFEFLFPLMPLLLKLCHCSLHFWESKKNVSYILPFGTHLRLWDTLYELERIQ
jgi:hypothetical protein